MKAGYKYRIYPDTEQQGKLAQIFGINRFVYNQLLAMRKEKRMTYAASSREFTKLRNSSEYPWLKDFQREIADEVIRYLQSAYTNFFRGRRRYPAFKRKSGNQSATFKKTIGARLKEGNLYIPRLGNLRVVWSRELPSDFTRVTISKTPTGKYYASFLIDRPVKYIRKTGKTAGIDLGIKYLATLSDGRKFAQFDSELDKRLALEQRRLARKKKGSKNRAKQRIKVAKVYERIAHRREDHLHKVTTALVRGYDVLCVEDLNVAGMVKNHNIARSLQNASFGQFRRMLEYKCKLYGKEYRVVGRFFASSKICSECGVKNDVLTLADREWVCTCKAVLDRDVNAAKNILAAGLAVSACGEDVRPLRLSSAKQEA